jgi:hypothetical protein
MKMQVQGWVISVDVNFLPCDSIPFHLLHSEQSTQVKMICNSRFIINF